jgi:hypothetical protein
MSPAGFEHAVPISERPQTHVLDRAAFLFISLVKLVRGNLYVKSNVLLLRNFNAMAASIDDAF